MKFASGGKEKNKPQESECKYWENIIEKISHFEKIYDTLGKTIESVILKYTKLFGAFDCLRCCFFSLHSWWDLIVPKE